MDTNEMKAFIACAGSSAGKKRFARLQFKTCEAAAESGFINGECVNGCVGLGDCVAVCVKGALKRVDGRVTVDTDICNGCGDCAKDGVCPQKIIKLIPAEATNFVPCSNKSKNSEKVRDICVYGCIGCGECERSCKADAIHVVDHHAVIDYDKCLGCAVCQAVCSRKIIIDTYHDQAEYKYQIPYIDCLDGCEGGAKCIESCKNKAISVESGKPVINMAICNGCGDCAQSKACPSGRIRMVAYKAQMAVFSEKCNLCGACLENCPKKAIYLVNGKAMVESQLCDGCGICRDVCLQDAIVKLDVPEYVALQREALIGEERSEVRKNIAPCSSTSDYIELLENLFGTRLKLTQKAEEGLNEAKAYSEERNQLKKAASKIMGVPESAAKSWAANMQDPKAAAQLAEILVKRCGRVKEADKNVKYVIDHSEYLEKPALWTVLKGKVKAETIKAFAESGLDINLLIFDEEKIEKKVNTEWVYLAKIAINADFAQGIRALKEAEMYRGTSIVIACTSDDKDILKKGKWSLRSLPWNETDAVEYFNEAPAFVPNEKEWEPINVSGGRNSLPEREASERIEDFAETTFNYDEAVAVREAMRCIRCREKPCMKKGCPNKNHIPEFIEHVAKGDFEGAYDVLRLTTLLPAMCGRVCQQSKQCEGACALVHSGKPVSIGALERFVADWHREHDIDEVDEFDEDDKKSVIDDTKAKVAVVGSGPAGLACASDLAKLGYQITVFEQNAALGGVLTGGIPQFRLPVDIVEYEIASLKKLGVEFICNARIGDDEATDTIEGLIDKGYKAVFIATGASLSQMMGIPGENSEGVMSAGDYLSMVNQGKMSGEPNKAFKDKASKIVIVGGGNVAMDACRCAIRSGADKVTVVYRRSEAEMPADSAELEEAKNEGVKIAFLTNPISIEANASGSVTGVKCVKMQLAEPDASGRRAVNAIAGSEFVIAADKVIMAVGMKCDANVAGKTEGVNYSHKTTIIVDDSYSTGREGVFAAGDCVSGPASVVKAMGAGKAAAVKINDFCMNL